MHTDAQGRSRIDKAFSMSKLKRILLAILCSISVAVVLAEDNSKTEETAAQKPAEKPVRRLKGEFKGHPISTPSDSQDVKPIAKSSAQAKTSVGPAPKQVVIDNTLVRSETPKVKGKAAPPPSVPPAPPAAPPSAPAAPVDLNGNGEAYWRAKANETRDRLAKALQGLEAARLEEKREENDFYAWDDGQYRDNVIKPAWDKSKEETIRAQEGLSAAQKAVDELNDEARKAGAYPGWIRE